MGGDDSDSEEGAGAAFTPSYKVSADLNTNVAKYAIAILLSSNITTYKGDAMTDALMVVVKKLRFDLPPGLENIPTDWAKVVGAGKYAPTQRRSKVKKVVRASLKPNEDGVYAPSVEHQNIYDLAQVVIKDTQCERNVYMKHPGNNFWDKLDDRLSQIRNAAKGDKKKIVRAFRQALTDDQNKHGAKTYVLDENVVDTFQQEVDDLLAIGFADAVTSAQAQGSNA
ncbi:hypothetical protein MVEN_00115300 [Mycena venus]|uniref:Uncharacterized protein n=1 Tax=Mycena venus TaxID=2733690 RepID=A0A8H6ZA42_9AGAR|nr:hypothetical protein MVEN_00115300 [Mycena venus]